MGILIIDDHPLIVQAVSTVIETLAPDTEVQSVDRVERIDDIAADAPPPGLVLLDLTLPGISGLDALTQVRLRFPDASIVIFSAIHDAATIARALRSGASGFIPKTSPRSVLIHALQLVLDGGIYVPPDVLSLLDTADEEADAMDPDEVSEADRASVAAGIRDADAMASLTERQRQIVELLADGMTTKQISRQLGISSNTVKSHVAVIFRTLGANNRAQVVAFANGRTGGTIRAQRV